MLRAIIYELKPTVAQKQAIKKACGCARFVYNKALSLKIEKYKNEGVFLGKNDLCKLLTGWKKEFPFLGECYTHSLQDKLFNVCDAFLMMRKCGFKFPKYKKKGKCKESYHINRACRVDYSLWRCYVAKIGWVRIFKGHNKEVSNIHSYTIEYKPVLDKYFITILYETDIKAKKENDGTHCGIDVGVKTFAVLSDGKEFENQKFLSTNLKKLRVLERSAARKYKYGQPKESQSKNWYKMQQRISKLHWQIKNQRKDYLHKLSRYIADNYFTVSVEDLNVVGMAHNKTLHNAIYDAGWSAFITMLSYKCCVLQKVGRNFASSQLCSACGYKNEGTKNLSVRKWVCPECGSIHNRDLNAAKNIDREGLSLWMRKVSGNAMLAPESCAL